MKLKKNKLYMNLSTIVKENMIYEIYIRLLFILEIFVFKWHKTYQFPLYILNTFGL